MEDISYFSFPQNKNIFTIPIDVNYRNNNIMIYPLKEYNNGWVSIDQLIREQSIDPDDYRGGSNFYMLA